VTNKEKLLRQLSDELDRATAYFLDVQRTEIEIVKQAPSGIPLPDGQQRIVQSGKQMRLAFQKYQQALKQYRAFLADGIVPEEDPGGKAAGE
jgi:hypothetical protein